MELETNTPTPDEARLLAQSKKLTLQPVHDDVAADDVPDSVLVAQHLTSGPVGNIAIDTEQNVASIPLADAEVSDEEIANRPHQLYIYVLTGVGLALLAAMTVLVIVQL